MKRAVKTPSRPATYGTATRLARTGYGLGGHPHGWSFGAIQDELGVWSGRCSATPPPAVASWWMPRAGRWGTASA